MLLNILTFLYLIPAPPQVDNVVTIPLPLPQVVVMPQDERLYDEFWGDAYRVAMEMGIEPDEVEELHRVTAYNPVPRQTEGNPNISSCGPNQPQQIALSRDMFFDANGHKHLCGRTATLIIVEDGEVIEVTERVIYDTMAARFTKTADIYMPTTDESLAYAWGVKQALIYID